MGWCASVQGHPGSQCGDMLKSWQQRDIRQIWESQAFSEPNRFGDPFDKEHLDAFATDAQVTQGLYALIGIL